MEQRARAVVGGDGVVDVLDVVDGLAEPPGGEAGQRHRVARRRLVGDQRLGRLDPELRLAGAGRRAAAQPGQLLADQVQPALLGDRRDPRPLRPGQRVGRVAAVVGVHVAVGDLPRRGADLVEEPPVVGDDDQAAGARPARTRPARRRPRRRGGWWARRGPAGPAAGSAARPAPPGGARRRTSGRPGRPGRAGPARARSAPSGRRGRRPTRARRRTSTAGRTTSRTVVPGGSVPDWSRTPIARSPRRVTRPESGSSAPVSIDSRVVLPPPLRPTTPIRSPAATPRETSSRITVVPCALCTRSRLTRFRGALIGHPVSRRVHCPPSGQTGDLHGDRVTPRSSGPENSPLNGGTSP